jgi:hypothetical protein
METKIELSLEEKKFNTKLFYSLIFLSSSLFFLFILYYFLRLDSNILSLVDNTYSNQLYFWLYAILTVSAVILFGVNSTLLAYRWRRFGGPKIAKNQGGAFFGSIFGVLGSACPVCGSTVLSALSFAGGIASLPFGGLELKALSVGFLALPIWLTMRDIKKKECDTGICVDKDHAYKEEDRKWMIALFLALIAFAWTNIYLLKSDPVMARIEFLKPVSLASHSGHDHQIMLENKDEIIKEATLAVLPEKGFQSKIYMNDSVMKLAENGVIDRDKFFALYESRGGLPAEIKNLFDNPSKDPALLTQENAGYYVNLLWPLGLANNLAENKESPIVGKQLFNFASTGGWNLGKEENGGAYFNKFKIVELTPEQEAMVVKIAKNSYRPCCDNSAFFQDCNHGSALMGLLALGVSQGLSEDDLYKEVLAFNSFWFPSSYVQTAVYFKTFKNIDWKDIDPKLVMSKDYSSSSGWYQNVQKPLEEMDLIPSTSGGGGCGA